MSDNQNGAAFGLATKPDAFDFEAFISGTQLAQRTVSAYRVDHRGEILALTTQHDALPVEIDDRESAGGSPRQEIAARIQQLRAEMESSRVDFRIRTLTPDEFKAVTADDSTLTVYDQMELQSVEPKLTADQWEKIGKAIGAGQWGAIVQDANDLVLKKVAVPDFSPTVSASLRPRESSAS